MENLKKMSGKNSGEAVTSNSLDGECESIWFVSGPPFDQRDYMISPSESNTTVEDNNDLGTIKGKKYGPCDIVIDGKYLLNSQQALKKLIELIRNKCTQPFTNRIKELISKYLQGCPSGYVSFFFWINNTC